MTESDEFSRAGQDSGRIRVRSSDVLSDAWARLEQVEFDYQRSNGQWQIQQREIYHRGHGAAVLLYNLSQGTIILIRQFRYPAWVLDGDGFLLEVPAGMIEADSPEETVRTETEQETGFVIGKPTYLFKAFATPGSVTEQLHYSLAPYDTGSRVGMGGGLEDEGEDIEVLEVSLTQAAQWIKDGKIVDAKTIILIQHAQLHLDFVEDC